jgi:hypothetical protein
LSWHQKSRNGRYYYQSVRDGDRVYKLYRGKGEAAERLAREVEQRRQQHQAEREARRCEEAEVATAEQALRDLQEMAKLMMKAVLVASDCYQHKRQWRRRKRNARGDADDPADR